MASEEEFAELLWHVGCMRCPAEAAALAQCVADGRAGGECGPLMAPLTDCLFPRLLDDSLELARTHAPRLAAAYAECMERAGGDLAACAAPARAVVAAGSMVLLEQLSGSAMPPPPLRTAPEPEAAPFDGAAAAGEAARPSDAAD